MANPFLPVLNSFLPEPQASLLNGILFGVKSSMPKNLYESLVATGTLHIVALSGMNISILMALVTSAGIFLGLKRKTASLLAIGFIVFFVLFVGPSPSVVRAAIMGSLTLLAVYFGKQEWGLLSLFFAAIIMLLWNFSLIKNLSFQLSFLATLGLLLANKKIECQKRSGLLEQVFLLIKTNLKLTFSAQLFTLPVILYNFHRLSLISPIANLLIEWAIQPIMILGFLAGLLGLIWWPLGILPAWLCWVPLTYLIKVVEFLAKIPGASIQF